VEDIIQEGEKVGGFCSNFYHELFLEKDVKQELRKYQNSSQEMLLSDMHY
jgi:hypothetical protein